MARNLVMLPALGALLAWDIAIAAQEPSPPEKDTKICRASEKRTGTRIRTGRRCRTAEEWRKEDEERSRVPLSATITEGQSDGTPRQRPQ